MYSQVRVNVHHEPVKAYLIAGSSKIRLVLAIASVIVAAT